MDLLRYVDGDYNDAGDLRGAARSSWVRRKRPLHYLAVPPSLFGTVADALAKSGCADRRAAGDREAVRPRPRHGARS